MSSIEFINQILQQSPPDITEDYVKGLVEGLGPHVTITQVLAIIWKLPEPVEKEKNEWRKRNDEMDDTYMYIDNAKRFKASQKL